ncbi:MAG: hypothetical protein IPK97_08185 [Ahniella sp.]|nr:hypothetical protein [Ahniella sp.]
MSVVLERSITRGLLCLLAFACSPTWAETETLPVTDEPIEPSLFLQQQMQLQQLNSQVEHELQRIQSEVRIESARRELEQVREGQMPELLGTFRIDGRSFAEFSARHGVIELTTGEYLVGDWRIAEIHVDRIRLCRGQSRQCRVLTPTQPSPTATARPSK